MGLLGGSTLEKRPSALLETLDPISVGTADFDVQLTGKAGIRPWTIKVANESPYALRVDVGGYQDWIGPWIADVMPTGGATVMHVHPVILGASLPDAPQSTLLVTLAPQGEQFPGTYPMALSRQSSTWGKQTLVGQLTGAAGATVGPQTLPVPAGTQSIGFYVRLDSGRSVPQEIIITGTQGQQNYVITTTPSTTGGAQWFPYASASDSSVDVTMIAALGTSAIDVLASPVVEAINIQETSGTRLPVTLFDPASGLAITTGASPSGRGPSIGVSLFDATPAPWQAAAASTTIDGSSVANGATLTLVAAVAAQKVYVHAVDFKLNAAGNFLLDRSDGTRVAVGDASGVGAQAIDWDGHGVAGAANTALRINNNSGASITLLGTVGYTQQ